MFELRKPSLDAEAARKSGIREAQIYNRVYQEVLQEVEQYSHNNNIALVIGFNGDPINPDRPTDIARMVTQPVVYHAKSIDITPMISLPRAFAHGTAGRTLREATQCRCSRPGSESRDDSVIGVPPRLGKDRPAGGRMDSILLLSWMTGRSGWIGLAMSER